MKKSKIQKIIFIVTIILIIMNVICNVVLATNGEASRETNDGVIVINEIDTEEEDDTWTLVDGLLGVLDGLMAIVSKILGLPFLLIAVGIQGVLTQIAKMGGESIEGWVTPDDIFFNRLAITDINFFNLNTGADAIDTIRLNIATWYYVLRVLAMVALLAVLIYVGIKMALSTIASEQAMYKKMLTNWAVSFALIFLLNYIIMFVLEVNDAFVGILKSTITIRIGEGVPSTLITQYITSLKTATTWVSLIMYCMLVGITIAFFVNYVKRMLTIGFLIIISPLITVTYSIDKMGDGKAQALNTWLKEFIFNVLIQPFHCIIYAVFVAPALALSATGGSFAKMALAIICMAFIWTAEKIVKTIFGFNEATSLGEAVAGMAAVKAIGGAARKVAGTAGSAVSKTRFGQNISSKVANSKAGRAARRVTESAPGRFASGIAKTAAAGMAGLSVAGFEMGLNSPANAAHAGLEAFNTASDILARDPNKDGSVEKIKDARRELERFSDLLAQNNDPRLNGGAGFSDYRGTQKTDFKNYVDGLIGTNMDMLNADIQEALRDLRNDPALASYYDVNTADGVRHLQDLQDLALDEDLSTKLSGANTVRPTIPGVANWTDAERRVITAIQIRNLARASQNIHTQYQAGGYNNPRSEVGRVIDRLV